MAQQRQPIDIVAFFGQVRCQQVLNDEQSKPSFTIDPIRGCWLSQTGLTGEGYARVSKKTNGSLAREQQGLHPPHVDSNTGFVTVFLHRLAYVARTGQNLPAGMQASHLCDQPNCINPAHITAEDGNQNASRKSCIQIRCPHHNFAMVIDLCNHTPACIKKPPNPNDFHCCLVGQEIHSSPPVSAVSSFALPSSEVVSSLAVGSREQAEHYSNLDFSGLPEGSLDEGLLDEDETSSGGVDSRDSVPLAVLNPVPLVGSIPDTEEGHLGRSISTVQPSASGQPSQSVDSSTSGLGFALNTSDLGSAQPPSPPPASEYNPSTSGRSDA
jgi:hypothetical protein